MAGETTPKTPMGGVKAFGCRNCGGQVNLLAAGQSLSAACIHCGAVADLTDENFRIISTARAKMTRQPLVEIGSKAQFEGQTWQVIGFMVREVEKYSFFWEEYLLFNPYYGFRFLANAYGHWSWIKMIHDLPIAEFERTTPTYHGKSFPRLTSGLARVRYVLGEFYWKVRIDDIAMTADYVNPPYMLSQELEDGGMIWSLGEYVEPEVVAAAFGIPRKQLPQKHRVGANQPNKARENFRKLLPFWLGSLVVAAVVTFLFSNMAPNAPIWSQKFSYPIDEDTVSKVFSIPGGLNNVEVQVQALSGLDNHWLEYAGVLHDTVSNINYDFIAPVEYYYGVTDGERWSEGSTITEVVLNEIPGGTYEMISEIASDSKGEVTIKVIRGVPIYSNLIWVFGILSIVPIFLFLSGRSFEKRRNE